MHKNSVPMKEMKYLVLRPLVVPEIKINIFFFFCNVRQQC